MILHFEPTHAQCAAIAQACFRTQAHADFLNAQQPFPAPDAHALVKAIASPGYRLSAVMFDDTDESAAGFIFCGNFFQPHADKSPHLAFGLNLDFRGRGYGTLMLKKFLDRMGQANRAESVYGHCYLTNYAACRTMESAGMTGRNIGIQHYSRAQEVMEFRVDFPR